MGEPPDRLIKSDEVAKEFLLSAGVDRPSEGSRQAARNAMEANLMAPVAGAHHYKETRMKGYKKKPFLIEVFALIYLLNPIGNLLLSYASRPDNFFPAVGRQISHGHPMSLLVVFFWLTAIPLAYGLYKVRLWAWYYFLVHSIGMFLLSLVSSKGLHVTSATAVDALFLLPIGYFISHAIRVPYFNPRVRWWEQTSRFQHSLPVKLNGVECSTYDLSREGAFVAQSESLALTAGQTVTLEIQLDQETIRGSATVRWVNEKKDKYPAGYGIQFNHVSRDDRARIDALLKSLALQPAR